MRWFVLLLMLLPGLARAQSSTVLPGELNLSIEVEQGQATPFVREMVILTIKGIYRRHITLETLVQPDFDGFSWAQLGPDDWKEERLEGEKVKVFTRRMAIYPDRAGELTIGVFRHKLTLTDEGDDWFEHEITSEPVSLTVAPAPAQEGWWFPVRSLRISDEWSNEPDQLTPGEGVLRIVRLEALGVTPEMIPPMPELASPSGMVFPHPEKRLVELTPEGPVTYAFWRWTIRPTNELSTIVEPISVPFYDTVNRQPRVATITAQRVAYGDLTDSARRAQEAAASAEQAVPHTLPRWPLALLGLFVFAGGVAACLQDRRIGGMAALQRRLPLADPLRRRLLAAAGAGKADAAWRAAREIARRDGTTAERMTLMRDMERVVFDPASGATPGRLGELARDFLRHAPQSAPG